MYKSLKNFLTGFWIIFSCSIFFSIIPFIWKFYKVGLSNNPSLWGAFGDYFGGILQSILALANLIIFVKLTNMVSKHQQDQTDSQLRLQKTLLLTQLRSEAIRNLSEKLNSLFENVLASNNKKNEILILAGHVLSFCKHNGHLFESLENNMVAQSLGQLSQCYKIKYSNDQEMAEDVIKKVGIFFQERDTFLQNLQKQSINALQ